MARTKSTRSSSKSKRRPYTRSLRDPFGRKREYVKVYKRFDTWRFGKKLSLRLRLKDEIPDVIYLSRMRQGVVRRLIQKDQSPKSDKSMNRIYRAAHKRQDELFSTALTREFVKGFFERRFQKAFSEKELQLVDEMIDLVSSVRIPTEFSGFALKDSVMQHPSNRSKALFADPYDTASLHSKLDTERRYYVEFRMNKAFDQGKTATETIIEGVKAAIEYTLNYFTAPITADNVFQYTRSSGRALNDRVLQEQIASREKMKSRYEELGGDLRKLNRTETQQQSWKRKWGLERSDEGHPLIAPPSPRRQPRRFANQNDIELLTLDI